MLKNKVIPNGINAVEFPDNPPNACLHATLIPSKTQWMIPNLPLQSNCRPFKGQSGYFNWVCSLVKETIDMLVQGGSIVTMNPRRQIFADGSIAIDQNRILAVGRAQDLESTYRAQTIIDAKRKVVFPGLINNHAHLQENILRGLGDDMTFFDWITKMMSRCESAFTPEDNYASALLGCAEAIKSGTTTIFDFMCTQPRSQSKFGDQTIRAMKEIGIRGILGRGWQDTNIDIAPFAEESIENTRVVLSDIERLIETDDKSENGRIRVWPAPSQIYTSTTESVEAARDLAKKYQTGVSIHVAETRGEIEYLERKTGKRDVDYLETLGLLRPNLLAVHCNWVSEREIRMLKINDVKVSHNPVCNMWGATGLAPIPQMIMAGITVGLGTDGAASNNTQNMKEVMKVACLLHKAMSVTAHHPDPTRFTAEKALEMATIDGARSVGLEDEIGSLEPGKKADLIILDFAGHLNTTPVHRVVSTLVYQAYGHEVDTVIIDGKLVMNEGKLLTVSESKVIDHATQRAEALVERAGVGDLRERPWRSLGY